MSCSACGVPITDPAMQALGKCFDCGFLQRPFAIQVCPRCNLGPRLVRQYLMHGPRCDDCRPKLARPIG